MKTTVRLYDLGYAEVRTYLAAVLFIVGNVALPQLFHLIPQGGCNVAAYLFLHPCRGLQVRLESGTSDSSLFTGSQFFDVRYACMGNTSRHRS